MLPTIELKFISIQLQYICAKLLFKLHFATIAKWSTAAKINPIAFATFGAFSSHKNKVKTFLLQCEKATRHIHRLILKMKKKVGYPTAAVQLVRLN